MSAAPPKSLVPAPGSGQLITNAPAPSASAASPTAPDDYGRDRVLVNDGFCAAVATKLYAGNV